MDRSIDLAVQHIHNQHRKTTLLHLDKKLIFNHLCVHTLADEEVLERVIESPKSCSKTSETARKLENKILAVLKVVEIHQVSFVEIHQVSLVIFSTGSLLWAMSMHELYSLMISNKTEKYNSAFQGKKSCCFMMKFRSQMLSL